MGLHHHHGHHGHGHGPHGLHGQAGASHEVAGGDPRRALAVALALNGGFLLVEAGVGWWTGSLALLGDAAHMLSDVSALVLALAAAQLARRPAGLGMTFGLHRAETLGGFVNGLALVLAAAVIAWEAVARLWEGPPPVEGLPVLVVGGLGLAINLGSAWALYRSDRENLNIRGALLHMLADALGSVGAIVAAGFLLAGFPSADAIVSVLIAALVGVGAWGILRDAGRVLLQLPPDGLDVAEVLHGLGRVEGVLGVHDLHVWTLDGREPILTVHVECAPGDGQACSERVLAWLHDAHGVHHATVQAETAGGPCAQRDCVPGGAHA